MSERLEFCKRYQVDMEIQYLWDLGKCKKDINIIKQDKTFLGYHDISVDQSMASQSEIFD